MPTKRRLPRARAALQSISTRSCRVERTSFFEKKSLARCSQRPSLPVTLVPSKRLSRQRKRELCFPRSANQCQHPSALLLAHQTTHWARQPPLPYNQKRNGAAAVTVRENQVQGRVCCWRWRSRDEAMQGEATAVSRRIRACSVFFAWSRKFARFHGRAR